MNHSPTPKATPEAAPEPQQFDFPAIMTYIREGRKVTRLEWADERIFVFLNNGHLQITLPQHNFIPCDLIVSDGDIFGKDWYAL